MSNVITPIQTEGVISKIRRPSENSKDVASWFKVEYLELNFGDYTGRPDSSITLQREYLAKFLGTGWSIDAVLETGDSGSWVNVGGTRSINKTQSLQSSGNIDSDIAEQWRAPYTLSTGGSVSLNASVPIADSPAYWTAYQKIRLKRRRLVAELVLKTMLKSFNDSYNVGRSIEDERYNQVVSLYTLMLRRSEDEGNAIASGAIDVTPLLERIEKSIVGSLDDTESSSKESVRNIVKAAVEDVNREYDNLVAEAKAKMISSGTYNGTVWPSVLAGIERQRQSALVKAKAEGETSSFTIKKSNAELRGTVGVQLVRAAQEISDAADKRKITIVELRNSVLKWMLDYIGGRQESYPELEEQATLTNQLGFSVGSAGSVL